jgi:hypothetical protein
MQQALEAFWGATSEPLSAERLRFFLEQMIRWYFTYLIEHPHVLRLLAWEAAGEWQTFQQVPISPEERSQFAPLLQALHQAQEASLLRSDLSAEMIVAAIQGLCWIYHLSLPRYRVTFGDTTPTSREVLEKAREQLISLLLDGLLPSA